jgi:hypothetical protein
MLRYSHNDVNLEHNINSLVELFKFYLVLIMCISQKLLWLEQTTKKNTTRKRNSFTRMLCKFFKHFFIPSSSRGAVRKLTEKNTNMVNPTMLMHCKIGGKTSCKWQSVIEKMQTRVAHTHPSSTYMYFANDLIQST